jgi:hypothetical protein
VGKKKFLLACKKTIKSYDLVFEHSTETLETFRAKGPLSKNDFLGLIEKILETGCEKEKFRDHFLNLHPRYILSIDGAWKFINPYMSESYINEVLNIYLKDEKSGITYGGTKIQTNIWEFGKILLSLVSGDPQEWYEDYNTLKTALGQLGGNPEVSDIVKEIINGFCEWNAYTKFSDLKKFYGELKEKYHGLDSTKIPGKKS